jgi:hypothetical protein
MIGMALGQVFLAIALSWLASVFSSRWDADHTKVVMPLWFAIVPITIAVGVSVHVRLFRHRDQSCPWVSLGWFLLAVNIAALLLVILMRS